VARGDSTFEAHSGSIAPLFFGGGHREVVERTIDSPNPNFNLEEFPFIVGALIMIGRIEEAEMMYGLREQQLSPEQRVACRFFLGVGFCRHSFYKKSLDYFLENYHRRFETSDTVSRFYRRFGLGFYHYFAGSMRRALSGAEKGFQAALEAQFLYGRALASDLKGHVLVLTGQVSLGLRTLELAEHLAEQLGARWLQEAIQSSLLSYRAQFGIEKNAIESLKQRIELLSKQDIYTQSALLLELAQAYLRHGKLTDAKEALNECCRIAYGSKNRRHTALLNLRYAYVHWLEGEPHLALNLVRNAITQIDTQIDRALELRLRGFERRLVKVLKVEVCEKTLDQIVGGLTTKVGEAVRIRMLARESVDHPSWAMPGEDPLGDLWDCIYRDPQGALEEILKKRLFGLLPEILPVQRGERTLYLDLEPGSLTIFDKGDVEHHPEAISRSLRSLLLELSQGVRRKETLIENIWKYKYHSLRHDPLIYSAVAKLRKTLGARSHWIEASELGYQLRPGVRVLLPPAYQVSAELPEPVAAEMPLNVRQQKILRFLAQHEFIDATTCRELFETSEVTASRDLSELMRLRLIARIGKGRATKYSRNQGATT